VDREPHRDEFGTDTAGGAAYGAGGAGHQKIDSDRAGRGSGNGRLRVHALHSERLWDWRPWRFGDVHDRRQSDRGDAVRPDVGQDRRRAGADLQRPVGCKGRYFTANFSDGVPLFFRYSSHDAYLLLGSGLYYLGSAPQRTGGTLHWDSTVDGHQINVQVSCAPPPSSAPLVTSGVPQACDLVTRAIATSALRGKVGPPERVTEGPDTTYCAYKSSDGARRLELYVEKSAGLASGGSWAQPKITGIGDEAHGGSADSGLAARKGTLGIEVHVDLGFAADNAANVAAEDALARELIVELPG
jgi:hypothetical protein